MAYLWTFGSRETRCRVWTRVLQPIRCFLLTFTTTTFIGLWMASQQTVVSYSPKPFRFRNNFLLNTKRKFKITPRMSLLSSPCRDFMLLLCDSETANKKRWKSPWIEEKKFFMAFMKRHNYETIKISVCVVSLLNDRQTVLDCLNDTANFILISRITPFSLRTL